MTALRTSLLVLNDSVGKRFFGICARIPSYPRLNIIIAAGDANVIERKPCPVFIRLGDNAELKDHSIVDSIIVIKLHFPIYTGRLLIILVRYGKSLPHSLEKKLTSNTLKIWKKIL